MLRDVRMPLWWLAALVLCSCGGPHKNTSQRPVAEHTRDAAEPEDDSSDDLQVEGLLGTIDAADAQPIVQRQFPALESCYSENVGANRFVGGEVELRFHVARDGSVKWVTADKSDLGNWAIEKCVLGVARKMTFPKPKGGEAELRFPIDFPGRGSVVPLDEERAAAELQPVTGELASCAGALHGRVTVTVYVGPGGEVKSAGFATDGEPFEDAWAECALGKALAWKLSDPHGTIWKIQGFYGTAANEDEQP